MSTGGFQLLFPILKCRYGWEFLMCLNGRHSSFYALPKIHKQDIPLRPIVSFCGATLYNLSKFLISVVAPLVGNSIHHVTNSTVFVQEINNM